MASAAVRHDVFAVRAVDGVIAVAAVDRVLTVAARDAIFAGAGVDDVAARAAFDHVVAAVAEDAVCARSTLQHVVATRAFDHPIAARTVRRAIVTLLVDATIAVLVNAIRKAVDGCARHALAASTSTRAGLPTCAGVRERLRLTADAPFSIDRVGLFPATQYQSIQTTKRSNTRRTSCAPHQRHATHPRARVNG